MRVDAMDGREKYRIEVDARARYVADQSDPSRNHYVFAYTITIRNVGSVTAQLISRHWIVRDAEGAEQQVRGLGVVGEQPVLRPGESFQYTSGCQLETPVGVMRGSYQMEAEDGTAFEVEIPAFTLAAPRTLH